MSLHRTSALKIKKKDKKREEKIIEKEKNEKIEI